MEGSRYAPSPARGSAVPDDGAVMTVPTATELTELCGIS
jgi:hypothetical protein